MEYVLISVNLFLTTGYQYVFKFLKIKQYIDWCFIGIFKKYVLLDMVLNADYQYSL